MGCQRSQSVISSRAGVSGRAFFHCNRVRRDVDRAASDRKRSKRPVPRCAFSIRLRRGKLERGEPPKIMNRHARRRQNGRAPFREKIAAAGGRMDPTSRESTTCGSASTRPEARCVRVGIAATEGAAPATFDDRRDTKIGRRLCGPQANESPDFPAKKADAGGRWWVFKPAQPVPASVTT